MLKDPDTYEKFVTGYKNLMMESTTYFVDLLETGVHPEDIKKSVDDLFNFETALAKISYPNEDRRNSSALYNPTTLGELKNEYPDIDWKVFYDTLFEGVTSIGDDEFIVVTFPEFFKNFNDLIKNTPKNVLCESI